ncbi:MAG: fibrinogen-like YCDxxxxGGGW domain-containing protein, partial [Myxococcota bacterium]|nr:fibrinogen-like YCDxxxxGGGW domain-containing protein [Myxococcota bacterium]
MEDLDLAQISDGTLTNAFTHVATSPEPVEILDINPGGVGSHVVTPDLGFIQAARVTAHVTNSDLSTLKFQLFTLDEETGTILLYDQGLEGTELNSTWPTEMTPVQGSFDTLIGKPTDGVWVFHVTDQGSAVGEGLSPKDGAIVSWSLELDVIGGDQVIVHGQATVQGDLQVKGETHLEGNVEVSGDLQVNGVLSGPGGIVVGAGEPVCDPERAGAVHYDPALQRLLFCDGEKLLQLRTCEAICPAPGDIPCGATLLDGCGAPCEGTGTGLSTVQCNTNATAIPCGEPVSDACDNDCGTQGQALAAGLCAEGDLVPCGDPITDPCGNPCGGIGSFCAPGLQCVDQTECKSEPGTGPDSPVQSCQGVIEAGTSTGDGIYWIDTDNSGPGEPFEAWCDMEPNGAWMLSYILCQDGGGDARATGLNHETPILPNAGSPVSSL